MTLTALTVDDTEAGICRCCKELWDGIISFPLVKDASVHPSLKEMRKEALKQLSTFRSASDTSGHFSR